MIALDVKNLKKSFYDNPVLDDISFQLLDRQIIAILGPNGCGKSTLLEIIADFKKADSGSIVFNKKLDKRKIGLMFQNHYDSLFPWKTVEQNIVFFQKNSRSKHINHNEILERFNLETYKDKYPYELSGGLSQLVNLARIHALNPDILLLDEPFSALDYNSNLKLLQKFSDIWNENKLPTLLVTHSIEEAVFLSDIIIIFSKPSTKIIKVIKNDLPRPRSINQIKTNKFHDLRKNVLENIEGFLL